MPRSLTVEKKIPYGIAIALGGLCTMMQSPLMTSALEAAKYGKVLIVTKVAAEECNTRYAQGGIACVIDSDDTFEAHVKDTLMAGAGLCKPDVVREIEQQIIANYTDSAYELDRFLRSLPFSYDYLRKLFQKEIISAYVRVPEDAVF